MLIKSQFLLLSSAVNYGDEKRNILAKSFERCCHGLGLNFVIFHNDDKKDGIHIYIY